MLSIKSALAKPFAKIIFNRIQKWANNPIKTQEKLFQDLISTAASTNFGKDHDFISINSYSDFIKRVPVRDYEALKPYVEKVVKGQENVLWPGKPIYFAKTSGTTSGSKYIPITKESIIFNTLSEISVKLGFASTTIQDAIETKTMWGGYMWEFVN
mgnify:CR=1 FL=1